MVKILEEEDVVYELDDLKILVNSGYPDIRRVINSAQRQSIDGKLIVDKQSIVENDYKLKVLEFLKQDKKSAFNGIRKVLADSKVTDYAELFRLLYDTIEEYAKGHLAEVILIIAKYELSDAQVVDKEINAMAMIVEILQEIK
jgi:replicative DNA helicase